MTQADANVEARRKVESWLAASGGYYDNLPADYETRKAIEILLAALNARVEPTLHPLPSEALAEIEFVLQSVLPLGGPVTNDHITEAAAAIYTAMQRSTPTAPVQGDDADAEWLREFIRLFGQGVELTEYKAHAKRLERIASRLSGDNNAALVEALKAAGFLCARVRELEIDLEDDSDVTRQFFGHVLPALARMEAWVRRAVSITSTDADGGRTQRHVDDPPSDAELRAIEAVNEHLTAALRTQAATQKEAE